jgi:hypothetical protein
MVADESHDDRTQSFVALTKETKVSHYRNFKKKYLLNATPPTLENS